jgi:hypothetical protein
MKNVVIAHERTTQATIQCQTVLSAAVAAAQ